MCAVGNQMNPAALAATSQTSIGETLPGSGGGAAAVGGTSGAARRTMPGQGDRLWAPVSPTTVAGGGNRGGGRPRQNY